MLRVCFLWLLFLPDTKQQKLDAEMKKFRERIERERAEKKLKEVHKLKEETDMIEGLAKKGNETSAGNGGGKEAIESKGAASVPTKPVYKPPPGLALIDTDEEDNNDEEDGGEGSNGVKAKKKKTEESKMEEDDEVDPLDAFMEGIVKEVMGCL